MGLVFHPTSPDGGNSIEFRCVELTKCRESQLHL